MVHMLDGTDTVLGPQVAPALFGYIIGLLLSYMSFVVGGHLFHWLHRNSNPHLYEDEAQSDVEDPESNEDEESNRSVPVSVDETSRKRRKSRLRSWFCGETHHTFYLQALPIILAVLLVSLFVSADITNVRNSPFYRRLWLECLFSPPAACVR